tara:strand:+ start:454 stop:1122 length:669 start_codon:yes stop_codon:yes gene_type:complete
MLKHIKKNIIFLIILILLISAIYLFKYSINNLETFENYNNETEKYLIKLLNVTVNVFEENNIDTWLECGTLLGAIRNNDFIHNDTDIDIGIYYKDFDKYKNLLDNIPDSKIIRNNDNIISIKLNNYKGNKTTNKIDAEPYIDIYRCKYKPHVHKYNFKNKLYNIPGKNIESTHEYLTILYDNWKIPSSKHASAPFSNYENIKNNYKNWFKNNVETHILIEKS